MLDRVGGAVMGLVAALFTAGIVALAAQSLPFGPSVGGLRPLRPGEREPRPSRSASPARSTQQDMRDRATSSTTTPSSPRRRRSSSSRWTTCCRVRAEAERRRLAGRRPHLQSIHPDYPTSCSPSGWACRRAQTAAINLPNGPQASVGGVFVVPQDLTKTQIDAELAQIHHARGEVARPGRRTTCSSSSA